VLFGYNTTLEYVEYYDPIAEDWEPVAPPINELNDIGDVDITTPADGEVLIYDDGDWVNGGGPGFTASTTITANNASWPVPSLASPIVKVTAIGGGGGGGVGDINNQTFGGAGGTTTFNAGGAGTVTGTGGAGGVSSDPPGGTIPIGSAGLSAGNGGVGARTVSGSASSVRTAGDGRGGLVTVAYLNLTGISTVNVTIGAGGTGATGATNGSDGGRGEVIVEYVAG
jgi:hypothetical protein